MNGARRPRRSRQCVASYRPRTSRGKGRLDGRKQDRPRAAVSRGLAPFTLRVGRADRAGRGGPARRGVAGASATAALELVEALVRDPEVMGDLVVDRLGHEGGEGVGRPGRPA